MAAARREDRLVGLRDELRTAGHSIEIHACDAAKAEDMAALADVTLAKLGRIDYLIYASGTNTQDRAMSRLSVATWDMMVNVNQSGAY